jgi:hypothetical protein
MELTGNVRLRRLHWAGQVLRLMHEREPKKALKGYIEGRESIGRPSGRWVDAVDNVAENILRCKIRRRSTEDRDIWRRRIEEAKAQVGL